MTKMREEWDRQWFEGATCCEGGGKEKCRTCLTYLNAWRDEFYSRISCALTHNLSTCDECRKCGRDVAEFRVELINELEEFIGKLTPRED